jgi:hypothetical protein
MKSTVGAILILVGARSSELFADTSARPARPGTLAKSMSARTWENYQLIQGLKNKQGPPPGGPSAQAFAPASSAEAGAPEEEQRGPEPAAEVSPSAPTAPSPAVEEPKPEAAGPPEETNPDAPAKQVEPAAPATACPRPTVATPAKKREYSEAFRKNMRKRGQELARQRSEGMAPPPPPRPPIRCATH